MRNTLRNKTAGRLAIAGLLAAALCPRGVFAGDDCSSKKVDPYLPGRYSESQFCGQSLDPRCSSRLKDYAKIAESFAKEINSGCVGITQALQAQQANDGQQYKSFASVKSAAALQTEQLGNLAASKAAETGRKMERHVSDIARTSGVSSPDADPDVAPIWRKARSPETVIQSADGHGKMQRKVGSLAFGSQLRKALLEAKNDFDRTALEIQNLQDPGNPNGDGSGETSGGGKKGGGLLDSMNPNTLLGLATAGMGLAAAMKKNKDASGVSASDTSPPVAPAAATGLGEASKAPGQSPYMSNEANKTNLPGAAGGGDSPALYGSSFNPDSDVTSRSSRLAGSGGVTAALPGGAAGLEGFGAGSRNPDAAKDPGAAPAKAPDDPAAGGFSFGGGSGGGLNFGSSSPPGGDPSHTEDPLKETLQDMAAAVDNSSDGAGDSADGIQADAGGQDFGSSNEFLFTRVRSAIQRSLKKGLVISGLSAKIR